MNLDKNCKLCLATYKKAAYDHEEKETALKEVEASSTESESESESEAES